LTSVASNSRKSCSTDLAKDLSQAEVLLEAFDEEFERNRVKIETADSLVEYGGQGRERIDKGPVNIKDDPGDMTTIYFQHP
jgi:hypothetical protein